MIQIPQIIQIPSVKYDLDPADPTHSANMCERSSSYICRPDKHVCKSQTPNGKHYLDPADPIDQGPIYHKRARSPKWDLICPRFELFSHMPWSTCNRPVQKKPLRKRLTIIDLFEGLWSVETRFRHQRQSQALDKTLAMSPSSTVHGGQYDTKYLVCDIRVAIACGAHSCRTHSLGRQA